MNFKWKLQSKYNYATFLLSVQKYPITFTLSDTNEKCAMNSYGKNDKKYWESRVFQVK